jgi:hypothetical protein
MLFPYSPQKTVKSIFLVSSFAFTAVLYSQTTVDILVIGGGGGAGYFRGGGGGGGGYIYKENHSVSSGTNYSITVGVGGAKGYNNSGTGVHATSGTNSSFNGVSSLTAIGGGGGGSYGGAAQNGYDGGSGGGGANQSSSANTGSGGNATTGQGNKGGNSRCGGGGEVSGGGGGGAGAVGSNGSASNCGSCTYRPYTPGNGGDGLQNYITEVSVWYSGGGGGGGLGANPISGNCTSGAPNISGSNGQGGGNASYGGGGQCKVVSGSFLEEDGGPGVVIVRYASATQIATGGTVTSYTGNGTNGTNGTKYYVHTFTTNGTFTITTNISTQPSTTAQNICINGTATALSCVISGTSPTYQWYSNTTASNTGGTIISGATNSNYTPPATAAGTTYYYCAASSSLGSETSQVSGAININTPSVSGTVTGGNTVTAGTNSTTLSVSGNTGTVQWQSSSDNTTFNNISGATSSTYAATNLSTTTYYRAAVTNGGCSTVYSNSNSVIVTPAPTGTTSVGITLSSGAVSITRGSATPVDQNLTLTFTGNLSGFTVSISENYRTDDVLGYTGVLPTGVSASWSAQRRALVFTGSASALDWQTLLRTVTLTTSNASCNPETRKISFTASTNYYNYFNGHYYEYVSAKKNWTQARDYAASRTFYGRQGYLVVISSAEENAYISQLIGYNTWMGGTDNYKLINAAVGYTKYTRQSDAEGKYHWVTGPEKGVNFSNGNNTPSIPAGRYCRWESGEPNNYPTGYVDRDVGTNGEHYMHIYADRKTWNDFPNDRYFASIIEYGDMPGDVPVGTVEGTRNVNVTSVSASGSITASSDVICKNSTTTLTLSGNVAGSSIVSWKSSEDNFLETENTISSTNNPYTTASLTKTTSFRAEIAYSGCTTVSKPITVTVIDLNAGTVVANSNSICTNQNAIFSLRGHVGTIQKWQTTTNTSGGSFTDIANTTTSLTRSMTSAGTHYFRSVVNNASCSTSNVNSDWYEITVAASPTIAGGSVSSQMHCSVNNTGTLELTGAIGTTYNWQISTNNGTTWANTSPATTGLLYTYANITQNTLFKVEVGNGCTTVNSNSGLVGIYGTNKCQWIGGTSTDWGTKANWCNEVIPDNGTDFDISLDAQRNLVLDKNRTVGTINFNGAAKYIYLGNHKLTVTDILDADTVNHIKTNGNGELKTSIPNNDSFVFCVGAGSYNPVTITNKTGSTDDFQVRLIDNVYDRGSTGNPLNTPRIKRTWFIDKIGGPANSGSGIDMAFDWYTPEVSGTINTYRLYHYNGNNWDKLSAGSYATRTRNLKYSGYTGTFSPFSMGDDVVLLPVNWVGLSCVREEGRRNRILWVTGSETLSDSFVVERGNTAGQFRRVGAIPAAVNSTTPRQYSMIDEQAPEGPSFYRVRQTDKLGNSSCSEICEVASASSEEGNVKIFPNPADNNLYVQFAEAQEPGTEVVVTDITGKEVLRRTVNKGRMVLPTGQLPSGVYAVQIKRGGNADIMQKIIIQH